MKCKRKKKRSKELQNQLLSKNHEKSEKARYIQEENIHVLSDIILIYGINKAHL